MKTLFASALVAAAALTAPAVADVAAGPAAAIAHFNADFDSQDNVRLLKSDSNGVAVSTRSGQNLAVYNQFNADYDSQDNVRGLNGATLYSGQPTFGGDIFAEIRAAQAEDE